MTANLENSAVATGLGKVSFHSNPKEGECQRMLKLLHSFTHLTCQQNNAQNSPSQVSIVMWTLNFHMFKLDLEKAEEQRSNCQHPLDHRKSKRIPEKHLLLLYWLPKAFACVDHNKLWKILKEMGIPDHLTFLLRNLYAGQEATVKTVHGTTDWFQIRKVARQGYILSPCLFNLCAGYIMRNAGSIKHRLESTLLEEILITSYMQMTSPLWQKVKN